MIKDLATLTSLPPAFQVTMALPTVTNPFGTGGPIVTGNPFGTGSFHPFGTTKPVSGGDTSFDAAPTNNVGKTVGIAVVSSATHHRDVFAAFAQFLFNTRGSPSAAT